jgi:hypothetical protein
MVFGRMSRLASLLILPVAAFLASCGMFRTASAPAGVGQEVIDGKFAFIVTQVNKSATFDQTHAQGVYVVVAMAIRNVGTETQTFESAAQKLKDNTGREYSASLVDPPVVQKVSPGLQVSVRLAFDVLPDVRPTQIMLHDSASSPGAPVKLKQPPSSSPSASSSPAHVNGD